MRENDVQIIWQSMQSFNYYLLAMLVGILRDIDGSEVQVWSSAMSMSKSLSLLLLLAMFMGSRAKAISEPTIGWLDDSPRTGWLWQQATTNNSGNNKRQQAAASRSWRWNCVCVFAMWKPKPKPKTKPITSSASDLELQFSQQVASCKLQAKIAGENNWHLYKILLSSLVSWLVGSMDCCLFLLWLFTG